MNRRVGALLVFVLVSSFATSCRRAPSEGNAPSSSAHPADRLAPGEAPPGTDKAWDLLLPRGSRIEGNFPGEIDALVALPSEDVANYLRGQAVEPVETVVGPNGTMFPSLHVKGAEPGHHLRVTVSDEGAQTRIAVARIVETPPPPKEPNDEAMKKAGLAPNGDLLDPDHRQ